MPVEGMPSCVSAVVLEAKVMWQFVTGKKQSDGHRQRRWAVLPRSLGIALFEKRQTDSGLTLMECVVAIAIVALTGALITPPLFLAAATRVQNRRSEQALQLAQGEIDRVRTRVEQGSHVTDILPSQGASFPAPAPTAIATAFLRSVNDTCNSYDNSALPVTELLPIDVDGDCEEDFYIQSFRTQGGRTIDNKPTDFSIGVRVYSTNVAISGALRGALETEEASLQFTTGEGNQRQAPLAVLYTQITWDGSGVALYCYHGADSCSSSP